MSNHNPKWTEAKKEMCRKRDGDKCWICDRTGESYRAQTQGKDFDLDHRDGDPTNDRDENLGLACHRCNCKKNSRGVGKFNLERLERTRKALRIRNIKILNKNLQMNDPDSLKITSAQYYKSLMCKPILEEELDILIEKHGEIDKEETINAVSNASTLSPEVCRKWLNTYTNKLNGHLEIFLKTIDGEEREFIRKKGKT